MKRLCRALASCLLLSALPALAAAPPPESVDQVFSDYGKGGAGLRPGCRARRRHRLLQGACP